VARRVRLNLAEPRLDDDDLDLVAIEGRKGVLGFVVLDRLETEDVAGSTRLLASGRARRRPLRR
jgi:hypothetical protein